MEFEILTIFPNPGKDRFTILYETPDFEDYDLRVVNALGQIVYKERISPSRFSQKTHVVNGTNWAAGPYFIQLLKQDGESRSRLVVKQ